MIKPCPLIFEPIYKTRIWGGRHLAKLGLKSLPESAVIGESWEIADLENDRSIVASGPAKGRSITELVRSWGSDLLGDATLVDGRFPLLLKYLDARDPLSVQVHPNETVAKRLGGAVRVKHEAWYIVDADSDGCIYRGLVDGADLDALARAIHEDDCVSLLNRIPVKPGQCYYLPSGTVHALGKGVVVTEVQTPSDITFRLFDWNRVDTATNRPRELHVDLALECIDLRERSVEAERRSHVASVWTTVTRLITCESFIIERITMTDGIDQDIPYSQLVVWMVLDGSGVIHFDGGRQALNFSRGDTVLLPAALSDGRITTSQRCTWLEITLPG